MSGDRVVDVAVVGAGPAGIGVGAALDHLDLDLVVLDREAIGASFRNWPDETRLLTPSYPSNSFGQPDLNAIVPKTSPAVAFDAEHLSGEQYAEYLSAIAEHHELPVETGVEVEQIANVESPANEQTAVAVDGGTAVADTGTAPQSPGDQSPAEGRFVLETNDEPIHARFVVWAGGEFGSPRTDVFPGAADCVHYSTVDSWADHAAAASTDEFLIVGGFESGIDAAVSLGNLGCSVTVLDRGHPWAFRHPDPSETLSPYTLQRLDDVRDDGTLSLIGGADITRVERTDDGRFEVIAKPVEPEDAPPSGLDEQAKAATGDDGFDTHTDGTFTVSTQPILATGFETHFGPVDGAFPREEGRVQLTDRDESPTTPGLFLAGPGVQHDGQEFCFIYKFRERFPVVAETIGDRLGVDTDPLEPYREAGLFLEDLDCCEPIDCDC